MGYAARAGPCARPRRRGPPVKRYPAGHSASWEAVPSGTRSGTFRDIQGYLAGHGRDQIRGVPLGPTVSSTVRTRPARPFSPERDYGRLPSGAPQSGQLPALPAVLPSPTTPNPDRTTRPRAAVRETPSFWASAPSSAHRSSSRRMWASCLEASNRGRGDMSGQFTASARAIGVRVAAVCGTLPG